MRRVLLAAGLSAGALLLAGGGVLVWRALPYAPPSDTTDRPASVAREMAYVARYWQHPNPAYGSFGGTDCVNFASQALHARGWAMTADWGTSVTFGRRAATPTWVSSTAMDRWFEDRPDRVEQVPVDRVRVGDIAQFDWDRSGDRDHTAIVSSITKAGGQVAVAVAEHSPAGLHDAVSALIAGHGGRGTVTYWHPLD